MSELWIADCVGKIEVDVGFVGSGGGSDERTGYKEESGR
jgi:hypothetical protein